MQCALQVLVWGQMCPVQRCVQDGVGLVKAVYGPLQSQGTRLLSHRVLIAREVCTGDLIVEVSALGLCWVVQNQTPRDPLPRVEGAQVPAQWGAHPLGLFRAEAAPCSLANWSLASAVLPSVAAPWA